MGIQTNTMVNIEAECDFCGEKSQSTDGWHVYKYKRGAGVFHVEDEAISSMTGFELFPVIGSTSTCFCSKGCLKNFLEREILTFIS